MKEQYSIPIMVNVGLMSSGKTIFSLYWATEVLQKSIITNMRLNIEHEYISDREIIEFMKWISKQPQEKHQKLLEEKFGGKTLIIDEAEFIFNARLFAKNYHQLVLIRQLGKIDCNLIANCHVFESDMDKVVRHLVNIICYCERSTKHGTSLLFSPRKVKDDIIINVTMDIKIMNKFIRQYFAFDPKPYYSMYKTEEVIIVDR